MTVAVAVVLSAAPVTRVRAGVGGGADIAGASRAGTGSAPPGTGFMVKNVSLVAAPSDDPALS